MNVSEVMANKVQMVDRAETLETVARLMKEHDIGCVLVGTDGKLVGLLTDRDIVMKGIAGERPLSQLKAADVMTADPIWCHAEDTVKQAAVIMKAKRVRRLPVLDHQNRVVGIVSLGDICTHASHRLAGELIEEVSTPVHRELAKTA